MRNATGLLAFSSASLLLFACADRTISKEEMGESTEALIGPYTVDSSCDDSVKGFVQKTTRLGRIAAASNGFAACLANLAVGTPNVAGPYLPQCAVSTEPHKNDGTAAQVAALLRWSRSRNPLTITCGTRTDGDAFAAVGNENWTSEAFEWSTWITPRPGQIGSDPSNPYWPMSQAAGIMWHEVMHNYGYDHPDKCTDTSYTGSYNFQANTVPYIVQGCMDGMVSTAGNVCHQTCGANQAAMVTALGQSTCECVTDPAAPNMDLIPCATEGGTCTVGQGGKYAAFGVEGQLVFQAMPAGTFTCDRATFGNRDPAVGTGKTCYFANYSWLADENQKFTPYSLTGVTGPVNVAFGANGKFLYATLDGLTQYTCSKSLFPGEDLAPNVQRACYLGLSGYHWVSNERYDGTTVLKGLNKTPVAYGANGYFKFAVVTGDSPCNNETFGDPSFGVVKACYVLDLGKNYLTTENQTFNMPRGDYCPVAYTSGRNGNVAVSSLCSGSCNNATFGDSDRGFTKYCWGTSLIR